MKLQIYGQATVNPHAVEIVPIDANEAAKNVAVRMFDRFLTELFLTALCD